ncbi:kinase-like domain-containing protein [Phaeosphaeriaceae sp. PMI808]|nr:kinase-like domain-containing protein [Phaeosphaeriaceae sp. PMI808]
MSSQEVVEYHFYCPSGVQRVLTIGTSAFIGEINDSTVLKYPHTPDGDRIGQHPRIIAQKGLTDVGLYLERAANESIYKYLTKSDKSYLALQQRVAWCREVAEAVEHIHSKRVVHCDIQPSNILVGNDLHLKLANFQGNHILEGGEVIHGWCCESCRYFCPRDDEFEANFTTDLFALRSTIHFIMTGSEVFPDIVSGEDRWHEKIQSRFASGILPNDPHACDVVTRKCWNRQYNSASKLLKDIRTIEELYGIIS